MEHISTDRLIYLILLLLMVAGWFFAQNRLNMNKTLQYAAIWGLIFVGFVAAIGLWEDISRTTANQTQYVSPSADQITVPRSRDGHYYLTLDLNDVPVRFVVDTGASQIVLTQNDAARIGLDLDGLRYAGRAMTANGEVRTAFVKIDEITLGGVNDENVAAVVNEGEMDGSLLGMDYLQRWGRIEIAQGQLILTR